MEENVKKKKNITIVLTVITIIIYVGIFFILDEEEKEKSKLSAEIVTNYSEFYTVNACASKYINFLITKDKDALLNVLSDEYKNKNRITSLNVVDALPIIAPESGFAANRMYYEKLKDGINKYYISGYLEAGGEESDERNRTVSYLIVYLDKENNLFSIEPYDGKEYIDGVFE